MKIILIILGGLAVIISIILTLNKMASNYYDQKLKDMNKGYKDE